MFLKCHQESTHVTDRRYDAKVSPGLKGNWGFLRMFVYNPFTSMFELFLSVNSIFSNFRKIISNVSTRRPFLVVSASGNCGWKAAKITQIYGATSVERFLQGNFLE